MKTGRLLQSLVCLGIIFIIGCNDAMKTKAVKSGEQKAQNFNRKITKTVDCNYLFYLPADYEKDTKKQWPLIMFLHGAGERGNKVTAVAKHGPPKLIAQGKSFEFIVVSPQCPKDGWWPEKTDLLFGLLDEIETKYRVDTDRVYLTGLSMGGFGTWSMAIADPNRLAAVAPICGGGERFGTMRLKKLPIWAFHGAKDNTVPLARSQEMIDAVKKIGGDAKLTIYPDAEHDSWTVTYDNPELYEWFLSHKISDRKK